MRIRISRKRLLALTHDLGMTVAAVYLAYFMIFADAGLRGRYDDIATVSFILLPVATIIYMSFGLYDGIWRFSSLSDFRNILKSVATLTVVLAFIHFASRAYVTVPREVVIAYFFILSLLLGVPRLLYRSYKDHRALVRGTRQHRRMPVLVAGTGYEAEIIIRALETHLGGRYRPVALMTTKRDQIGHRIRTIPILGHVEDLESVFRRVSRTGPVPQRLIVTSEALRREPAVEEAIVMARRLGLQAERLLRPAESGRTPQEQVQIAPIEIEDLLGREMYRLDTDLIRRLVEGRRILVTGGGGSIGGELCRQVVAMGCSELTVIEKSERPLVAISNDIRGVRSDLIFDGLICDVRDGQAIAAVIREKRPDIVFHAAALKHVPIVEAHVREGILTNVHGTRNVADACLAAGVRAMVMISTDKAVRPSSVMGATKRAAESYCEAIDALSRTDSEGRDASTRFFSVRFGNVLGSSGSVVPLFTQQLRKGGPLTVTHPDMRRYFMTISEAVSLVLMASAHGLERRQRPTIYVLDMGEPVRIVDLAERMIRLAGMQPGEDVKIEYTGVRPGEKLYEELFLGSEQLQQTELQGILVAEPQPVEPAVVRERVEALCRIAETGPLPALLSLLHEIVPEYRQVPPPPADAPLEAAGGA